MPFHQLQQGRRFHRGGFDKAEHQAGRSLFEPADAQPAQGILEPDHGEQGLGLGWQRPEPVDYFVSQVREHGGILGEPVVHEHGERPFVGQAPAFDIECQIDPTAVDAEMVGLGAKCAVQAPRRLVLVGVAGQEDVDSLHLPDDLAHGIGEVVLEFPPHVAERHDGIDLLRLERSDAAFRRLHRIDRLHPAEQFRRQPRGQARGGQPEQTDLEPADFADHPRGGVGPGTGQCAGLDWFSIDFEVGGKHGHLGLGDRLFEHLAAPVEIVVADHPAIVSEHVEQWTYLKFPFLKKIGWKGFTDGKSSGVYKATPLSRLNVSEGMATPLANEEYQRMYDTLGGKPVQQTLATHWARIIELLYAAERWVEPAEDPEITSNQFRAVPTETPSEGVGVVEAPRGTLYHHYKTDDNGMIKKRISLWEQQTIMRQ